jgi:hypothetical protein
MVFPDGTTMLVDVGAVPGKGSLEQGPARPDETRSPAEWIARYITEVSPWTPATLDYAIVTLDERVLSGHLAAARSYYSGLARRSSGSPRSTPPALLG